MDVAKKHQDELKKLKELTEGAYIYFRSNYERYNFFRKFVFQTSLSSADITILQTTNKPQLESNFLESGISRQRGEFSKQEPSIQVMAGDDSQVDPAILDIVQGHCKHILYEANKNGFEFNIYTDMLAGGFSDAKVGTRYAHEKSFNQVLYIEKCFDSLLVGYDPMAQEKHKGDAEYSFEFYPKYDYEIKREYPGLDISKIKYMQPSGGFSWSYKTPKEKIILMCDFYKKKKERVKLLKVAGQSRGMTEEEYEKFVEKFKEAHPLEQVPQIIDQRQTEITRVVRYKFIETQVLEYEKTSFRFLPHIHFGGNSMLIRDSINGAVEEVTRPMVYHAKDTQRLRNFAVQCLGNELENMIQHKWMAAEESLPQQEQFLDAWTNPQTPSTFVYKAFADDQPNRPNPLPQAIVRPPIPPEIIQTIQLTDSMLQAQLGTYDAALGIQDNDLSGIAIQEGATQSNNAAMPYIVGYLAGLQQICTILVDMIPKYIKTPRTLPIVKKDGTHDYVLVNAQNSPNMEYEENALNIKIEPGLNFDVQRTKNMLLITQLMKASEPFAQFMSVKGLPMLIENLQISGRDQLKQAVEEWMKEQQKIQQQQQQQQQQMPNPEIAKIQMAQQKIQQDGQIAQSKLQLESQKMQFEQAKEMKDYELELRELQKDYQEMKTDMAKMHMQLMLEHDKAKAELARADIQAHHEVHDQHHRHAKEKAELAHEITKFHMEHELEKKKEAKPHGTNHHKKKKTTSDV